MADNNLFSSSYIERDLEMTGGPRVVAKIFGNSLDFSGIVVSDGERYVLKADIVPDQSRIFNNVKIRIDGLDYTDFEVRERSDGKKVVTVNLPLNPVHFKPRDLRVDVIWNYTEEDLKHPDIFEGHVDITIGDSEFTEEKLDNGATLYQGGYMIKKGDFWRSIGEIRLEVNPPQGKFTGLSVRYFPNYKDYPERFEVTNYDNRISELPFDIVKHEYVDLDTLKCQNKKFELIWHTDNGEQIETHIVDVDTLGWETGFNAPVPIEINKDAYPTINLKSIYRNFVFTPEYKSFYKGNHELRGKNLSFKTKVPVELTLQEFKVAVLVNGEETGYTVTPSTDSEYNYNQYDVNLENVEQVNSIELKITAVYPDAIEVNYGVVFTELF